MRDRQENRKIRRNQPSWKAFEANALTISDAATFVLGLLCPGFVLSDSHAFLVGKVGIGSLEAAGGVVLFAAGLDRCRNLRVGGSVCRPRWLLWLESRWNRYIPRRELLSGDTGSSSDFERVLNAASRYPAVTIGLLGVLATFESFWLDKGGYITYFVLCYGIVTTIASAFWGLVGYAEIDRPRGNTGELRSMPDESTNGSKQQRRSIGWNWWIILWVALKQSGLLGPSRPNAFGPGAATPSSAHQK